MRHRSIHQSPISKHYDVIVVGGGMSGLCAVIASARQGVQTALIQDRLKETATNGTEDARIFEVRVY